jgi:hypothetical protein
MGNALDTRFIGKIKHALNADVARRLLIRYFVCKGYDQFDALIYPPLIADLPRAVTEMCDKVEVVPYAARIDPPMDSATLGWNLFVLGVHRMFLGETHHVGLRGLALQLQQGTVISEDRAASYQTTPRRVVCFVTKVLSTHRDGMLNLIPRLLPADLYHGQVGGALSSRQFFSRAGFGT